MKAGEKVVCLKRSHWEYTDNKEPAPGPNYRDIVTIGEALEFEDGIYLELKEFPDNGLFYGKWFRPLDYEFVNRLLEKVSKSKEPVMVSGEEYLKLNYMKA